MITFRIFRAFENKGKEAQRSRYPRGDPVSGHGLSGQETGHPKVGSGDLRDHRALGEQDMGKVQGGQERPVEQKARRAGRQQAEEGPALQG